MQNTLSIPIQELKQLFTITYQGTYQIHSGSSTHLIHNAFSKLIQISLNNSNHFLGLCETILETQHKNKGLCLSVTNFIKVITKKAVDQKLIDQCGPKNFINRIEHIFDNSKISPLFKENIAVAFIKAALHFRMNFQKIIQKILYLYNVRDSQQAVLLSRPYIQCDHCLDTKLKGLYYKKILPAQFKYLSEEIRLHRNLLESKNGLDEIQKIQESQRKILQVLRNIHSSLTSIPFQKFESHIFACLQKDDVIEAVNSIKRLRKNKAIMILMRELVQKIVENLYRMRRMEKMPILMREISELMHQQWKFYQSVLFKGTSWVFPQDINLQKEMELQQQLSLISFLTTGLNYHIIMILDDKIDIWKLLVIPLYEMKVSFFNKNCSNVKQAFLILQDCTFLMKSQSLEIIFNKFIKTLLVNYQSISSKFTIQLDTFLLTKVPDDLNSNDQNKLLMVINLITLQASHFLTEDSFILKVQNFIKANFKELFRYKNPQVYFQSLLFLNNFIDDIFCQQLDIDIFLIISQHFIQHTKDKNSLNNQTNAELSFIRQIQKRILCSFFSAGFSQRQIKKSSQILINFLSQVFDTYCLQVFISLIKNYTIEDRITLDVIDKVIQQINHLVINQQINHQEIHQEISVFIQFLVTFFDLDFYKHLFQSTLVRVLPIFSHMIGNQNQFQDDFFIMIKNFTTHLEYVPQNYLEWMGNIFNFRIMQTQQGFKSLAIVLKYLRPSKYNKDNLKYELFVNCIALNLIQILVTCNQSQKNKNIENSFDNYLSNHKNLNYFFNQTNKSFSKKEICAILCLHQLIHFHSQYLTKKILNHIVSFVVTKIISQNRNGQNEKGPNLNFTFQKGKYQLVLILLFKRRLFDTNQILIQKGLQKRVYDTIYMKENRYLLEYDTPLFIKQQVQILRKHIHHDELQMAYANTSFLAVFSKFSMLFESKKNNRGKSTLFDIESDDSDEEDLETQSQLRIEYKQMTRLVLGFPLPKQWNQIDDLKEMKSLIEQLRSNSASREWLEILYEKCLNNDQKNVMEQLMKNLETINGKYRHIVKVNKNLVNRQPSSQQNQDIDI